ncbi:hypothetical protein GEV29_03015 [Aeromicrobium sp. SMF47]|uniref:hypothetical protein n=1 Tax=Aeromicrobium yanjiei TaxID=2662028 RepID=UPI00129DFD46|nr:hypothetical protein [Aeromicrobium yanjiei]MRJ75496.1 hypothetical protein [Aeromicrobium yanjiei]
MITDEEVPAGTVFVFFDESYEPFVGAAAASFEASDVAAVEGRIESAHSTLAEDFYLDGLGSYDEFLEKGFHATVDTTEVSTHFIRFLAHTASFKTSIVFSDGTTHPALSPKKRLMVVFDRLLTDVLRQYRSRPMLVLIFESAQELDPYVRKVVERAARRQRRSVPRLHIEFRPKRDPHILAVPDYVLHIFNAWLERPESEEGTKLDPTTFRARDLRSVLGSISEARSLEGDVLIRRNTALLP